MNYSLGKRCISVVNSHFYIAPSAQLIGEVRLGEHASVWFNAVLRADDERIVLGNGSNVQDGTIIHCDHDLPTLIGDNVTVGHQVLLHGCEIADETLIGNCAIVLDGARIGRHCVIGAGALIPPREIIPDGSVVMGSPGRVVRGVGDKELAMLSYAAESYRKRALRYRSELAEQAL